MRPVTVDIKDLLLSIDANVYKFATEDATVFIGRTPANNRSNTYVLFDTGGGESNPKFALEEYTFQALYINDTYETAFRGISTLKQHLEGMASFTINATYYLGIDVSSTIAFLKYDEQDRAIFTINFRTWRVPSTEDAGNRIII